MQDINKNTTASQQKEGMQEPVYPEFKYPKKIPILAVVFAFVFFWAINVVVMPILGLGPIQNNDEAGALRALVISLVISTIGGVVVGIFYYIKQRKKARLDYKNKCETIRREFVAAKAEKERLIAEQTRIQAEKDAWYKLYHECEFCGGELEFHDIKGSTHQSSYSDGYRLDVKSYDTGIIRENRVNYYITTGIESYRCPCCHYYIKINYEKFNGISRSNTDIALYGRDDEMKVPRETIMQGRLYTSFKIVKSQIRF